MTAARVRHVDDDQRRRRLAWRHRLVPERRTDDVAEITDDLVALHSSDPVTVFLSVWCRMTTPALDAVDAALYDARSVIRHHAMRRTIWVMGHDTLVEANVSSTAKIAAAERRQLLKWLSASDEVDDPERWLADTTDRVVGAVRDAGALSTRELGRLHPELTLQLTAAPGTKHATTVAAHARVALLAAFEAHLVRARPVGGWTSGQYSWAAFDDWTSGLDPSGADADPPITTADAADRLVSRLLRAFGPMTSADVQWWTGWTRSQTTRALEGAARVSLDDGSEGWMTADDADDTPEVTTPWVALLPGLDPTVMGWKERGWYLDDDVAARVFDRWGNAGPTVWVDGQVVGGWARRDDGELALELLRSVSAEHRTLLDDEVARLDGVIGDDRFSIRFPSPSHKDLTA